MRMGILTIDLMGHGHKMAFTHSARSSGTAVLTGPVYDRHLMGAFGRVVSFRLRAHPLHR